MTKALDLNKPKVEDLALERENRNMMSKMRV